MRCSYARMNPFRPLTGTDWPGAHEVLSSHYPPLIAVGIAESATSGRKPSIAIDAEPRRTYYSTPNGQAKWAARSPRQRILPVTAVCRHRP